MRILISTPCYNQSLDSRMVGSLLDSLHAVAEKKDSVDWDRPSSPLLAYNRNVSAQKALKENFDWLLYWDADTTASPADFIYKLIDTGFRKDASIIGAPCRLKTLDEKKWNCAIKHECKFVNFTGELPSLPFEVDVIGTGLMLVKVSSLNGLAKPLFTITDTWDEQNDRVGFWPEDWGFCEKMKANGGIIIAEPSIQTTHYGAIGFQ